MEVYLSFIQASSNAQIKASLTGTQTQAPTSPGAQEYSSSSSSSVTNGTPVFDFRLMSSIFSASFRDRTLKRNLMAADGDRHESVFYTLPVTVCSAVFHQSVSQPDDVRTYMAPEFSTRGSLTGSRAAGRNMSAGSSTTESTTTTMLHGDNSNRELKTTVGRFFGSVFGEKLHAEVFEKSWH